MSALAQLDLSQISRLIVSVEARRPGKKESASSPTAHQPQSAKLKLLLEGKFEDAGFADVSAAVQSLLTLLAIEHLLDRGKIEAAFKSSGLYKDFRPEGRQSNWIEKWERLRNDELDKAITQARDVLAKQRERRKEKPTYTSRIRKRKYSEIKEQELDYLWPKRVPRGNATLFSGDPGIGKSLMALDLVGRGSIGADFLDGTKNENGPFKSLLLMDEDDAETIIKPRLNVIGANMEMITAIEMIELLDDEGKVAGDRGVALENDLKLLRAEIEADPLIKLIVIDPLSNYMGNKNMFKDQELRAVLMPIVQLAQDTGVSVIVIMHNSKQAGRSALQKVGAALGGVGVARIGWTFLENDGVKEMILMKKNLGTFDGITFTTETAMLDINGKPTEQARMKFLKLSTLDANTVIASDEDPKDRASNRAENLIREMVPKGAEIHSEVVIGAGEKKGLHRKAIMRARSEMEMRTNKKKDGWYWSWPDASSASAEEKSQDDTLF